jgi:TRAP-type mannitol/chloroaromatic compound transport system permease large subunit
MVCWLFVGSWIFSSVFSLLAGIADRAVVAGAELTPLQFLILAQFSSSCWAGRWNGRRSSSSSCPSSCRCCRFGIDPLFFGVLVALNIQTSFLTPPMAMSAFYLKGVAPAMCS